MSAYRCLLGDSAPVKIFPDRAKQYEPAALVLITKQQERDEKIVLKQKQYSRC